MIAITLFCLAWSGFTLQAAEGRPGAHGITAPTHISPDTLDWKRYFPLEIGNVWEYREVESGPPLWRREVIGDTVRGGWRYFVLDELNPVQAGRETFYARYDTAAFVVILSDLAADTIPAPRYGCCHGLMGIFDLSAAFGDTVSSPVPDDSSEYYTVDGGYGGIVLGRPVEAVKCFDLEDFWRECYAADVGPIEGYSLKRVVLTYAKINGVEFGTSRYTSVEDPDSPQHEVISATVFPNPARSTASVIFDGAVTGMIRITVYNVMGQVVSSEYVLSAGEHRLMLGGLPAGLYFVKLSTPSGGKSIQPLTVVR
jgi:hypothetical protein